MTILFLGAEGPDFTAGTNSGSHVTAGVNTVYRNIAAGAVVNATPGYLRCAWSAGATDVWVAFRVYLTGSPTSGYQNLPLLTLTSGGVPVMRLLLYDNTLPTQLIWARVVDGITDVQYFFNQTSSLAAATLTRWDIRIVWDRVDPGVTNITGFSIYKNGTLQQVMSTSMVNLGTTVSTTIDGCELGHCLNSRWSEVMVATTDTRQWSLYTLGLNGSETANTGWDDRFLSIDAGTNAMDVIQEGPTPDTDDFARSTTLGALAYGPINDMPSGSGYTIHGVKARAWAYTSDSVAPANLGLGLRVGGTNYIQAKTLATGSYGHVHHIWETSPATSTTWTLTEVNGAEFVIRADT